MKNSRWNLFEVFGIELEYMIVDRESLDVRPFCEKIFHEVNGNFEGEYDNGRISWSNELAAHVVELKTSQPDQTLSGLADEFSANIGRINDILAKHGACLLPGGAHPWMNPFTQTRLWTHDSAEVYEVYDRIFNCKGHGWSNLQSMHINLPFANDEQFALLHAAIRLLLPLLPALTATTPILDGIVSGFADTRLEVYRHNQKKIPEICGRVIPEAAWSHADYQKMIFDPIIKAIAPHDPQNILDHHFLNSRGAIARFDRGSIEIRIIDTQECPAMDLAIAAMVADVLAQWCERQKSDAGFQAKMRQLPTAELADLFEQVIRLGAQAELPGMVTELGLVSADAKTVAQFWNELIGPGSGFAGKKWQEQLKIILGQGNLSSRIMQMLGQPQKGSEVDRNSLFNVLQQQRECLQNNQPCVLS